MTDELAAAEFPEVELEHLLVDAAAMRLLTHAAEFDVLVTENMFGDILTDEASVLAGSLGMAPSASIGAAGRGLYEPIHGTAPDIAGRNLANPCGMILSVAMMLELSLDAPAAAREVEAAVASAVAGRRSHRGHRCRRPARVPPGNSPARSLKRLDNPA